MQYPATIARLALGAILVCAAPCAGYADQIVNILVNGGGEDAPPPQPAASDWLPIFKPSPGLRLWRDDQQAQAGKYSLAIENSQAEPNPAANNWAQKLRFIPAGRTLRLSGFIRTEDAQAANICAQCWGKDEQKLIGFTSTPVFRKSHDWTFVQAPELTVPPGTEALIVRAALTGTGRVWFDELSLSIVGDPLADDRDLAAAVPGKILKALPVVQDCMILAYMPTWAHGDIDNIAVANNEGGVRTLLKWQDPTAEDVTPANRKFLLAMYARQTNIREKPGPIQLHELSRPWKELIGWENQPPSDAQPALKVEMSAGPGWKLFDVTPLVRSYQVAGRPNHGVVLCFPDESVGGDFPPSSGYQFVSREGSGAWENRRPTLLVVDPSQPPEIRRAEKGVAAQPMPAAMSSAELLEYVEYLASIPNIPIEDVIGAKGAYMQAQDDANRGYSTVAQHGGAVGPHEIYVASQSAQMPPYEAFIARFPLTPSGLQAMSLLATFYSTVERHADADRLATAASRLGQETDLACLMEINRAYVESAAGKADAAEARLRRVMARRPPLVDENRLTTDILFVAPSELGKLLKSQKRFDEADRLYQEMIKQARIRNQQKSAEEKVNLSYAAMATQYRIEMMLDQNKTDAAINELIDEFSRQFPDYHDPIYTHETAAQTFKRQIDASRSMRQMQSERENLQPNQPDQPAAKPGPDRSN